MAANNRRLAMLRIDLADLMSLSERSDLIHIEPVEVQPGWPPEKYLVTYSCRGIASIAADGTPQISEHHQLSLYLSREYPTQEPTLLWLTDIWHPNIGHEEPRHVCTNAVESWFAGKSVALLVIQIGEMVQYKHYHAQMIPPFPLDQEAARWVRDVAEKTGLFGPDTPLDPRPLERERRIMQAAPSEPIASPPPREAPAAVAAPAASASPPAPPMTPPPSSMPASMREQAPPPAARPGIVLGTAQPRPQARIVLGTAETTATPVAPGRNRHD